MRYRQVGIFLLVVDLLYKWNWLKLSKVTSTIYLVFLFAFRDDREIGILVWLSLSFFAALVAVCFIAFAGCFYVYLQIETLKAFGQVIDAEECRKILKQEQRNSLWSLLVGALPR